MPSSQEKPFYLFMGQLQTAYCSVVTSNGGIGQFALLNFFFSQLCSNCPLGNKLLLNISKLKGLILEFMGWLKRSFRLHGQTKMKTFFYCRGSTQSSPSVVSPSLYPASLKFWFKATGFYYTMNAGPSLGLILVMLLLPCVMEILQLWDYRTGPFMCFSRSQMGLDVTLFWT